MVVHDFYRISIPNPPLEANAVLIVDSNAVLPCTVSAKRFQMISRWHSQVVKRDRSVQDGEFHKGPAM